MLVAAARGRPKVGCDARAVECPRRWVTRLESNSMIQVWALSRLQNGGYFETSVHSTDQEPPWCPIS